MTRPIADPPLPAVSVHENPLQAVPFLLRLFFFISLAGGFALILYHATHTPTYTIDSYFYLSKARQFANGNGLTTSWNDGVDPKYFPGYSLILGLSLICDGSHVAVQLLAYLLSVALLVMALKEARTSTAVRLLAASAFAANPITIKWYSLPMAEGAALALGLAATVLFLRFIRVKKEPLLFAACAVGGFAVITRIEALFLFFLFVPLFYRERRSFCLRAAAGGAAIFLSPLLLYGIGITVLAGAGPAYPLEFARTVASFNVMKNIMYNIWAPFGLMQQAPVTEYQSHASTLMSTGIYLAGFLWLIAGGAIFWAGLFWGAGGRLGATVRAAACLFLAYAGLHALWYYRYERFMLPALPFAALVWGSSVSYAAARIHQKTAKTIVLCAQAAVVMAGLALGHVFSSFHADLLQQETSNIPFAQLARAINGLNEPERRAVLTDLGPHLAYYLQAHSYMDDAHGNYWQRSFAPDQTAAHLERLGIGWIVTRREFAPWMAEHEIPPEMAPRFSPIPGVTEGVNIIRYLSSSVSDS